MPIFHPGNPEGFTIDGTAYDVIDFYEPDESVGMFGEAGAWVCPASWKETGAMAIGELLPPPDHITLFVTSDLNVWDHTGQNETGQKAEAIW